MFSYYCPIGEKIVQLQYKPYGDEVCPHCGGTIHRETDALIADLLLTLKAIEIMVDLGENESALQSIESARDRLQSETFKNTIM